MASPSSSSPPPGVSALATGAEKVDGVADRGARVGNTAGGLKPAEKENIPAEETAWAAASVEPSSGFLPKEKPPNAGAGAEAGAEVISALSFLPNENPPKAGTAGGAISTSCFLPKEKPLMGAGVGAATVLALLPMKLRSVLVTVLAGPLLSLWPLLGLPSPALLLAFPSVSLLTTEA